MPDLAPIDKILHVIRQLEATLKALDKMKQQVDKFVTILERVEERLDEEDSAYV